MSSAIALPLPGARSAPATDAVSALRRTRWVFVSLCAYVLSQAYMLPVITKGPTWAFWPAIADFASIALVVTYALAMPRTETPSAANRGIFFLLLVVAWGWLVSYLYPILFPQDETSALPIHGLYYLIRIIQFIAVFFVAAQVPFPPSRIAILRRVTGAALALTCISVFLTYFSIVPLTTFGAYLPKDKSVAGAWIAYAHAPVNDPTLTTAELNQYGADLGLGTIGYNHGYTALQVLMLLGLFLHLGTKRPRGWDNFFLVLAIFACFFSESRDGLLGILLFAAIYWIKRPRHLLPVLALGALLFVSLPLVASGVGSDAPFLSSTLAHQDMLFSGKTNDSLSGRPTIWKEKLALLGENPVRWVIGTGLGSLWDDNAANAHMLYLQLVVESGVIGLLVFLSLAATVLTHLRAQEGGMQPLFWMTVVLLVTSLTQETFYPVAAFGHFVGLYLCAIAIALRNSATGEERGEDASWSAP